MKAIKKLSLSAALCALVSFSINLEARVLHVPSDEYNTIQSAIDAAQTGDEILVADGDYRENIRFIGHAIRLIGNPTSPSSVVIDGQGRGAVVTFNQNEPDSTLLSGFKLTNGIGFQSGHNRYGGGIYCAGGASPTIDRCITSDNAIEGIPGWGGGIYIADGSSPEIRGCVIRNNVARAGVGGGIAVTDRSGPQFIDCEISGNSAGVGGDQLGGGALVASSTASFINCTFVRNSINGVGGGGLGLATADVSLLNCIFLGNERSEIYCAGAGGRSRLIVSYSNVPGAEEGIVINNNCDLTWAQGNIDEDPLFADPDNAEFQLTVDSPCIDAGNPAEEYNDPDGTRADMGAYYFDQDIYAWFIQAFASVGEATDQLNFAAGIAGAAEEFDDYDVPETPGAPFDYVRLYFPHPEWGLGEEFTNFSHDVRPEEALGDAIVEWPSVVATDIRDSEVQLSFSIEGIPEETGVVLVDLEAGGAVNLREDPVYSYNSGEGGARRFSLRLINGAFRVNVTAPARGDMVFAGDQVNVEWEADGYTEFIDGSELWLYDDSGEESFLGEAGMDEFRFAFEAPDIYATNAIVKVKCYDAVGNEGIGFSAPFTISPRRRAAEFPAGWSLAAIPLRPNDGSIEALFEDDIEGRFWIIDPATQQPKNEAAAGEAFWIGLTEEETIDVEGEALVAPMSWELHRGWNMIGAPFPQTTSLEGATINSAGERLSLQEAGARDLISTVFYTRIGGDGEYREHDQAIGEWAGYYFRSMVDDIQLEIAPAFFQGNPGRDEAKLGTPESWRLRVRAFNGGSIDTLNILGEDSRADDGFDGDFDYPAPPPFPTDSPFVNAYFYHPEWSEEDNSNAFFSRDIRRSSDAEEWIPGTWELRVVSSAGGEVRLTWDRENLPAGEYLGAFVLYDRTTREEVDLLSREEFIYQARPGETRILSIGHPSLVVERNQPSVPDRLEFTSLSPNPFNSMLTIGFSVPSSQTVRLGVFGLDGRLIAMLLDDDLTAGERRATWNADAIPAGVYLLRLEGSQAVHSRKVLLMK